MVPLYSAIDINLPQRTIYCADDGFGDFGSQDAKPMLIVLQGLSGGLHKIQSQSVLRPLAEASWRHALLIIEAMLKVRSRP